MRMTYRLHPVSSRANSQICSTWLTLAYVLLSNVIEQLFGPRRICCLNNDGRSFCGLMSYLSVLLTLVA